MTIENDDTLLAPAAPRQDAPEAPQAPAPRQDAPEAPQAPGPQTLPKTEPTLVGFPQPTPPHPRRPRRRTRHSGWYLVTPDDELDRVRRNTPVTVQSHVQAPKPRQTPWRYPALIVTLTGLGVVLGVWALVQWVRACG